MHIPSRGCPRAITRPYTDPHWAMQCKGLSTDVDILLCKSQSADERAQTKRLSSEFREKEAQAKKQCHIRVLLPTASQAFTAASNEGPGYT